MYGGEGGNTELVCSCIMILFWVAIAFYVYNRADKLGMNALLWAILVFLFNLIPLIIFAICAHNVERRQRQTGTAGYTTRAGVYGGQPAGQAPAPEARTGPPDPDFRDDYLDELIEDGRLNEARKYLREMINMAREMNDQTGLRNYANYEPKINKAAMEGTRRRREY